MGQDVKSVVFEERAEAEWALVQLRDAHVSEAAISIIGHPDDETARGHESYDPDGSLVKSFAASGAPCWVLGITGVAIPAIMPLAAAGAIAGEFLSTDEGNVQVPGSPLARVLTAYNISVQDADYYEDLIRSGSFFFSVDMRIAGVEPQIVNEILNRRGTRRVRQSNVAAPNV